MSCVTCHVHMSQYIYIFFFWKKWWSLLLEGLLSKGLPRLVFFNLSPEYSIIFFLLQQEDDGEQGRKGSGFSPPETAGSQVLVLFRSQISDTNLKFFLILCLLKVTWGKQIYFVKYGHKMGLHSYKIWNFTSFSSHTKCYHIFK